MKPITILFAVVAAIMFMPNIDCTNPSTATTDDKAAGGTVRPLPQPPARSSTTNTAATAPHSSNNQAGGAGNTVRPLPQFPGSSTIRPLPQPPRSSTTNIAATAPHSVPQLPHRSSTISVASTSPQRSSSSSSESNPPRRDISAMFEAGIAAQKLRGDRPPRKDTGGSI